MDQQTPQRQRSRSRPSSPVRVGSGSVGGGSAAGVSLSSSWNSNSANAHANTGTISNTDSGGIDNNAATIMLDVTRSLSMESGGANSIVTHGSGSAACGAGGIGIAVAGAKAGGESNTSFRASPAPSFRTTCSATTNTPVRSSPPPNNNTSLTTIAAGAATPSATRAMPPPPWPTTTASSAAAAAARMMSTPQRCTVSSTDSAQAHAAPSPFQPLTPPPLVNMAHSSSTTTSSNNNNNKNLSINLSITKSGDSFFSQGTGPIHDSSVNAQQQQQQAAVLLGLEELERQQADVEKRREREQEEQQRRFVEEQQQRVAAQQQHQSQQGLPPLPPTQYPRHTHDVVPSQIHLDNEQLNDIGDEEDTILSSDGLGGGRGGNNASVAGPGVLKRVVSIEKFRGSVNSRLQRLRSWSQDALHRSYIVDPATGSSVDSTQPATLTTDEGGDGDGGLGQYKLDPVSSGNSSGMMISSTTTSYSQQQHRQNNVKSCKKMMMFPTSSYTNNNSNIISEPYLDEGEMKPLVYGYLYKLGRNGHWQRRFFETNGERLTYYKNVKRTTVLATLDLCKVGEIAIDDTDPDGCTFTIQVKNRPYYLRAADKARCNDWVIILNRAREARMQVGNIQLATATTTSKVQVEGRVAELGESLVGDSMYRSQTGSDDYAQPCIVISALRPRTRALMNFDEDEEDNLQNLLPDLLTSNTAQDEEQIEATKWDTKSSPLALKEHQHHGVVGLVCSDGIAHSMVDSGVGGGTTTIDDDDDEARSMAKWQKRHSTWHTLSVRFLRWARSISHHADACRRENDVMVVPSHVVMASQQKQQQSSRRASGATDVGARSEGGGGVQQGQGGPQGRKQPAPAPDLMDSTPATPGAGSNADSNSTHDRLRANTDSPAFGITYV